MSARHRRLAFVVLLVGAVGVAVALAVNAFRSNLLYFYTPSEVASGDVAPVRSFRVGGLVREGSVERDPGSLQVRFDVTDTAERLPVVYEGVLPDLFREGQGVVVRGRLDARGVFRAEEVLAKHDERYMPPEAADAVAAAKGAKRAGGAR